MSESRGSILVVDDDQSLRLLSRVNLELDGFEVREAATMDEARVAVYEARPDAILLDVHLHGTSSEPFLEEARAAGIPVALVTGTADVDELRGRADAFLVKPFLPEALVDTAHRLASLRTP
jgi:DNA-binding NtrC family response regulator